MAKGSAEVTRIKMDIENLHKFFQDEGVENIVMDVAEEVARDANTMAGGDAVYQAEIWRERNTRAVANVTHKDARAMNYEAKHGTLARVAGKDRS